MPSVHSIHFDMSGWELVEQGVRMNGHESMTEDALDFTEAHDSLHCALARLSKPDRRLMEQLFWEERTETEIAQQLGVSHQAVSKRKRAVLHDLRRWLDGWEEDF